MKEDLKQLKRQLRTGDYASSCFDKLKFESRHKGEELGHTTGLDVGVYSYLFEDERYAAHIDLESTKVLYNWIIK